MPTLRNILACVVGILVGGGLNLALVVLGPMIVASPPGVDVTSSESLRESIHLFEPRHFVVPFLAHALGTLAGSFVAFILAASRKSMFGYLIGAFFFVGGVTAAFTIPAPLWFIVLDLAAAYLPMSYLAVRLGGRVRDGDTRPSAG